MGLLRRRRKKGFWVRWIPEKKKLGRLRSFLGRKSSSWQAKNKHYVRRSLMAWRIRRRNSKAVKKARKDEKEQELRNKAFDEWSKKHHYLDKDV